MSNQQANEPLWNPEESDHVAVVKTTSLTAASVHKSVTETNRLKPEDVKSAVEVMNISMEANPGKVRQSQNRWKSRRIYPRWIHGEHDRCKSPGTHPKLIHDEDGHLSNLETITGGRYVESGACVGAQETSSLRTEPRVDTSYQCPEPRSKLCSWRTET